MAKAPAMLFYTADFLVGVSFMSMQARGQYITLICLQHQMGHMSIDDMVAAVGEIDKSVLGKFVVDENGLYYNERAEKEIKKRNTYAESRRKNRAKDEHMKNICKTYDEHMKNICETYEKHMENENENENETVNENNNNNNKPIVCTEIIDGNKTKNRSLVCTEYSANKDLNDALVSFSDFRRKSKKPMTDNAMRLLIKRLDGMTSNVNEQIAILEQSIVNGWTGIYPLKKDTKQESGNPFLELLREEQNGQTGHNQDFGGT